MCFAPQQRARFSTSQLQKVLRTRQSLTLLTSKCALHPLFEHLNFQKCSGVGVLCTFWLGNVLCTTTACTFWTSQLPKVLRRWCALYLLTWKFALRHKGVQFFISHLPDGSAPAALATLRSHKSLENYGKTQCFATLQTFRAPASSFCWLFLFSYLLSSSLLFSDSSHLCFSICPYCRKFDFWISFDK